jgi:hypothetical protein
LGYSRVGIKKRAIHIPNNIPKHSTFLLFDLSVDFTL